MPQAIDKVANFVERIETVEEEIESIMAKAMAEAKGHREDIREIYAEAKNKGLDVKAVKGLIKWRKLEKKQDLIPADFDDDSGANYELLVEQLGALGRAAADKHSVRPKRKDDDDADLRSRQQQQTEKERQEAEAIEKLGRGPAVH